MNRLDRPARALTFSWRDSTYWRQEAVREKNKTLEEFQAHLQKKEVEISW